MNRRTIPTAVEHEHERALYVDPKGLREDIARYRHLELRVTEERAPA